MALSDIGAAGEEKGVNAIVQDTRIELRVTQPRCPAPYYRRRRTHDVGDGELAVGFVVLAQEPVLRGEGSRLAAPA